jgi:uracil-DNA glycosylase
MDDPADVLAALRAALDAEARAGGRYVPHVDVPPPVPATHAFDAPDDATIPVPPPDDEPLPPDAMPTVDLFGAAVPDAPDPSLSPYERVEARIPEDHVVKPAKTLAELEEIVRGEVFIELDRNRIQPVFGTGDPEAGLMVIGEAPGADEDRMGEPFVGRAGQLLNKILAAIGFERKDVYITNILKSRPPGNRDPEPEEIAGHLPILLKQIVLIRPRVILCVGKTSGNALLERRSSLGALRDREHSFEGIPLFVTYHPAALLRNEQWKRPTWEDVKLMRTRYDELAKG